MKYTIKTYMTARGKRPFRIWLNDLSDIKAKVAIEIRLDRVEEGNLGDCEPVGSGVYEFKFDVGPGYRVYFGKVGLQIILLFCAGSKRTQPKDIVKAKEYFQDYKIHGEEND